MLIELYARLRTFVKCRFYGLPVFLAFLNDQCMNLCLPLKVVI